MAAPLEQASLRIGGDMTIYQAAGLKEEVLQALAGAGGLELDLSAVSEIDTSGVQLLMLARNTAQANGQALRLLSPSAAVQEVLATLNLTAWFEGCL
jgi:anti-sigma B factor antagonist